MRRIKQNITTLLLLLGMGINAQEEKAQEEMITDRPDATESPSAVPVGSLQLETGAFYDSFKEEGIKNETLGYNTTLLRYGVLENFELRVGWSFEEERTTNNNVKIDDVRSGFSPLLLGMKVEITEEKGLLPEIGFLGHLMLSFTASQDYRPETTGVDFRFSLAHTLNDKSSIAYNIGAQWGNDSPEAAYVYTLVYGYSILDALGIYAEVYGDIPEDNKANHYWDAGITYSITNNIQLDATVGKSITDGQDILLAAGISYRIPK